MCDITITRIDSIESIASVDFLEEILVKDKPIELITIFKKMELNGEMKPEPLLIEDKQRFVLFPIKHNDVSLDSYLIILRAT